MGPKGFICVQVQNIDAVWSPHLYSAFSFGSNCYSGRNMILFVSKVPQSAQKVLQLAAVATKCDC